MVKDFKKKNNYLRLYRKKQGLTQKDVASLLELKTTNAISDYERGVKIPQLANLLKLEIIYHTPVAFLFSDHYRALRERIQERKHESASCRRCSSR